jgi:hypothetical protein
VPIKDSVNLGRGGLDRPWFDDVSKELHLGDVELALLCFDVEIAFPKSL